MVVRMKNGKNIRGALSYNEAKVKKGMAELILASRYGCDAAELSFSQKLQRFTNLNENCVTSSFNAVHISLNFSAEDSIDTEKMQLIAQEYMQAIGFEKQPYLVYRHNDTAHPHLHIVTTPLKPNGKTINLHNLVQRKSEPARKTIEESFQLIKAEGRRQSEGIAKVEITNAVYGKAETKQAIAQIVRAVADLYRFTSFEEYQLILEQFNILADKGETGTRLNKFGGLQYFIINAKGEKASVGIKASSIYTSPTLKNIEKRFSRNSIKKAGSLKYTSSSVGYAISQSKLEKELVHALQLKKIAVVQTNGKYFFIDHRNKTVTTPQELGISPNALENLNASQLQVEGFNLSILQQLIKPEFTGPEISGAFLKKKRKKKR